jgi:hypothetical protein
MIAFIIFIVAPPRCSAPSCGRSSRTCSSSPPPPTQKKVAVADGSRDKLPEIPDLSSAECKERYPDIPEYMGDNPPNMGLGIKREAPTHY